MSSFLVGLISAACTFAGAVLGMRLQRRLPGQLMTKEMQDLVKVSAGTIATLTALVLGLLVSSAKSSFDTIQAGIVQASAKFVVLDRALARYGPEAKGAREELKRVLAAGIERVWPTKDTGVSALTAFESANGIEIVQDRVRELIPQNDAQRQFHAHAVQLVNDLTQTRWLLIEQAQDPIPMPLLLVLIFWLILLFASFGLFAPHNGTALAVLFVGACAISASILLVLELSDPFDGFIKVSSAPMRNALQHLGK